MLKVILQKDLVIKERGLLNFLEARAGFIAR